MFNSSIGKTGKKLQQQTNMKGDKTMKNRILGIIAIALLLSTNACKPVNKGHFAKDIPVCIKQKIEEDCTVVLVEEYYISMYSLDEYCNVAKRIYIFTHDMVSFLRLDGYDENCNHFFIGNDLDPVFGVAEFLPDGSVKYNKKEYSLSRIVFKQK